jgi:hypothetical protein
LELKFRQESHWAEIGAPGITIGLPKPKSTLIKIGDNISIGFEVSDFSRSRKISGRKGIEYRLEKTAMSIWPTLMTRMEIFFTFSGIRKRTKVGCYKRISEGNDLRIFSKSSMNWFELCILLPAKRDLGLL